MDSGCIFDFGKLRGFVKYTFFQEIAYFSFMSVFIKLRLFESFQETCPFSIFWIFSVMECTSTIIFERR